MADRTRRSMLRSAAVGAAAATASGGLLAAPALAASSDRTRSTRLRLSGHGVHRVDDPVRTAPGTLSAVPESAGERCIVIGTVRTDDGATGAFHADVVRLHSRGQAPHGSAASTLEQHVFTLPEGTLIGAGTADVNGSGTFAIIGGSGAYAGSRGSYTGEQHRSDLSGDGTATFDFSIER